MPSNNEYSYHYLLREMQEVSAVLPVWKPGLVLAARSMVHSGLATVVTDDTTKYAVMPKLVIQITDAGRQVRLRKYRKPKEQSYGRTESKAG